MKYVRHIKVTFLSGEKKKPQLRANEMAQQEKGLAAHIWRVLNPGDEGEN